VHDPESTPAEEERFVAELTANQAALHAFLVSLMPGLEEADEVLQRTNLTLWRKRASFEPGTNFRAWAFACARWTLQAYLKETRRKSWLLVDDELARSVGERMTEILPDRAEASLSALRACLETLRPIDRNLVLSHYEQGRTLAECATQDPRGAGSLKVTLFRLRLVLRRCITARLAREAVL
jgi:RNA polymerase sigma-70 factor, ECF subfamily